MNLTNDEQIELNDFVNSLRHIRPGASSCQRDELRLEMLFTLSQHFCTYCGKDKRSKMVKGEWQFETCHCQNDE